MGEWEKERRGEGERETRSTVTQFRDSGRDRMEDKEFRLI
jgi:hypothetical protein